MTDKLIGVYGASGFGKEIMHWVQLDQERAHTSASVVFIDDGISAETVNDIPVLSYAEFCSKPESSKQVVLAIANAAIRKKLDLQLKDDGIPQLSVQGDYSFVRGASLKEGSILSAFVDITNNVEIGRCFHANTYSYIGHDCVIGNYVTFAPRVSCNGNVHIEDNAYIGTGAILKQGTPEKPLRIGKNAVVGMGAVVTKDVPPGVTVVGNPAKIFERKN